MKLIFVVFGALLLLLGQVNTLGRLKQFEIKVMEEDTKPLYTKALLPAVINTWNFSNATKKGIETIRQLLRAEELK